MMLPAPLVALLMAALPSATLAEKPTIPICSQGEERRVPAPDTERAPPCAHWCDPRRKTQISD